MNQFNDSKWFITLKSLIESNNESSSVTYYVCKKLKEDFL